MERIRGEWRHFRAGSAGKRFVERYERRRRTRGVHPPWLSALNIGGGILLICIGLVLAVMPGPAILFYALGGALIASESRWVAHRFDRVESCCNRQWHRFRRRCRNRSKDRS